MSEESAIERVEEPVTVDRIASNLRSLAVGSGDTLLVHSSLSALGWVAGGAQAVVDGLQDAVTETGTLVLPTFTGQYTNPALWENPPVPDDWVAAIPEAMPAYRPQVTPTRSVGAVPECFRNYPGVVRSGHPTVSFAAWGEAAKAIVADHRLDDPLGENSPLSRLYDRDAAVLHLGTDYVTNTSFHLAEYRAEVEADRTRTRARVRRDGEDRVVSWEGLVLETEDFADLGAAFEEAESGAVSAAPVGAATARLVDQRPMVDFAVDWLEANR